MKIIKSMLLLIFCIISGCKQHNDFAEEFLMLPLNSEVGVTTENEYSGWITISVAGTGYISSVLQTDAMYLITEDNQPIDDENTSKWGILIDNYSLCCEVYQSPPFARSTTAFNPAHRYSFEYYVGTSSRYVTFSSGDDSVSDNDGELAISVTTKPLFPGR
jgi:hypothetical protein